LVLPSQTRLVAQQDSRFSAGTVMSNEQTETTSCMFAAWSIDVR